MGNRDFVPPNRDFKISFFYWEQGGGDLLFSGNRDMKFYFHCDLPNIQ